VHRLAKPLPLSSAAAGVRSCPSGSVAWQRVGNHDVTKGCGIAWVHPPSQAPVQDSPATAANAGGGTRTRMGIALRCLGYFLSLPRPAASCRNMPVCSSFFVASATHLVTL
jgi:hypothetical protein